MTDISTLDRDLLSAAHGGITRDNARILASAVVGGAAWLGVQQASVSSEYRNGAKANPSKCWFGSFAEKGSPFDNLFCGKK